MISPFRLRSLFALVLGTGALGAALLPAAAGDKIIYSSASDTLAPPAVERPDKEQLKNSSTQSSLAPVTEEEYYLPPSVSIVSSPRKDRGNLNDQPDLLGTGQLDGNSDNLDGTQDDDPYASNPSGKQKKGEKAWDSRSASELSRNPESLSAQFGSAASRLDPSNPFARRDRQNEKGFGSSNDKSSSRRSEDSYSSDSKKPSLRELISRYQNASSFGSPGTEDANDLYGSPAETSSTSSSGSSLSSLFSPNASTDQGGTSFNPASPLGLDLRAGKPSTKDDGRADLVPDQHAWSEPQPVSQPSAEYHKPYAPPSQAQGLTQSHPANLAFPTKPWATW
jgi:hypothetical protein